MISATRNIGTHDVVCVDCGGEMSAEDRMAGLWYPDRWCIECVKKEDERSEEHDTIPGTGVTWRLPRYLLETIEWKVPAAEGEAFDKLLRDMLAMEPPKGEDDEE